MTRYFCTDYQVIDWLMTKYGIRFDFFEDEEQLTVADDISRSLHDETIRAYVQPASMAVLEGLPEKTRAALMELGMWPEVDDAAAESPTIVTA